MSGSLLLAVESSCDETGIALVEDGRRIHANVVASQVALHVSTGGIVPEVAARAHLRWIVPVLEEALATAGVTMADVDGVAVTYGPGLAGSLLVGINFAKTLAWAHGKPLVPVNHLEGHVYAGWLLDPGEAEREAPPFPLVALVVSGGHTFLVEMRDHLDYRYLGGTLDDAAGEAFDKVGRLLGLGYPGGPAISREATKATARDRIFPRAWLGESYDVSFSGLKTAARRIVAQARADGGLPADERDGGLDEATTAELAWGFQDSVVDVLATKTIRAAEEIGAQGIVLGGGVAANSALRSRIAGEAEARGIAMVIPRPGLCTDNGAMIGAARGRGVGGGARGGVPPGPPGLPCRWRAPSGSVVLVTGLRLDPRHVRRVLSSAGLHARRSLSQNFLADVEVLERILAEAAPRPGRGMLEIGPGLGFLTGGLLAGGAEVTAVELDAGLADFLRGAFAGELATGQLRLIEGDALDQPLVHLIEPPYDVVANLPYHITSPMLHRLLGAPPLAERLVLMVQREVAERIAAAPGGMSYLSVFVQYHARARVAFRVPREAFEPAPSVESAVLVLEPFDTDDRLDDAAEDQLWRIVQAGFRERRKMLHNVLRRQLPVEGDRVDAALAAVGIAPDRRPQTLAVGEWIALSEALGPIADGR